MEKLLRAGGQASKKQRILRPLHEFLEEQQEPFLLEDYLLDRQYSSKRIHAFPNGDLSSEGIQILGIQSRAPSLPIRDSYQTNGAEHIPWPHACGLLEMNHRNKKKRRRDSRGKIRTENLYFLGYSEEYHIEEVHVDVKRLKFTVEESKTTEMIQLESKRGSGMEDKGDSIAKTEASPMQYMKFFSFKKVKKMNKPEKRKKSEAEKSVKCFLFKSILKKMTPTNVMWVSKKLSNAKTKLRCGISEGRLCKDNRVQDQVSDIVSSNSFKEVPPCVSDHNSNVGANCVSSEPVQAFPDLIDVDSFSAEGPRHPLQLTERISQELEVERSDKVVQWQTVIRGSSSGSVALSSTSSSGCSLFESSFDSDMGSTSVDKLSSENSFGELTRANFNPSEGISHSLIEATCSSGDLSLDNDEYHAKDCQPWVFKGHDKLNDVHKRNCSTDEALQQDYIRSSTPTPTRSMIFEISEHEENPKKFSGSLRNVNLVFGEMKWKSQENEDEKNVSSAYDLGEKKREIYCQEKNLQYASANSCSVDSKQLTPVSVFEMSSDEEPSALKQTDACTPIHEHRFPERFNEGGQHSWKDCSTSEQRAQRKAPHKGGNGSFSDSSHYNSNTHESKMHNFSQISSHASSFRCQEESDGELGETEEYVRKLLSSPDTMSCLMGLNDSEIRDLTGFSPPAHEAFLPSQCLKRKEIPMCARKLLFDCVKEILKSPKKQYGSGVLKESRLNECFVSENLAKVICSRIYSWMETDTNITERMVDLTWEKEGEDWTKYQVEAEEIGNEIEAHVFGLLIEELVDDLSHLQP